jgi:glycosyltransferase involved in cell wall biosynthesis
VNRQRCSLAVLASHPIQYFTPIYRSLAQHPDIDLEVMFYRDFGVRAQFDEQFGQQIAWDTDQLAGYRSRFLTNISPFTNTFNPLHAINPGAFTELLRGFDALWLNGYMYPSNWLAAAAARLSDTAILLRSELRLAPDRQARASDALRDHVIRTWVRTSDALLYIGEENRRAYLHYGARPGQLFFVPYSADAAVFRAARDRATRDPAAARARWGIPDGKVVLLFAGKLTPRKHPEAALELAADPQLSDRVHLVVAGSGPMEASLKAMVQGQCVENVSFLGFVNQSALPDVYGIADVFVMPSEREPWGIVVNEAMAAGVVPVVSDAVGAMADLVHQMETGIHFPSGDWKAMRDAVTLVVRDHDLRHAMAARAMERAAEYDHSAAASGVVNALSALGLLTVPERVGASMSDQHG